MSTNTLEDERIKRIAESTIVDDVVLLEKRLQLIKEDYALQIAEIKADIVIIQNQLSTMTVQLLAQNGNGNGNGNGP